MTEGEIMAKVRYNYCIQYEKDRPIDTLDKIDYITLMEEADEILTKEPVDEV